MYLWMERWVDSLFFEIGCHYVTEAGPELQILLLQPPCMLQLHGCAIHLVYFIFKTIYLILFCVC